MKRRTPHPSGWKPEMHPRTLGALPLMLAGGWLAYSSLAIDHALPLPFAIPADRLHFHAPSGGRINVYTEIQGAGRPLVLLHSINAAASAYEMRPLFLYYRGRRPVWALDLPGFGFSSRGDRVYTAGVYEEALLKLLDLQVNAPADVIALSLSAEFAVRAALARPESFHSLTLISPTGFDDNPHQPRPLDDWLCSLLFVPVWSQALFDLLASRPSIRFFLKKNFVGPVDEGMVDYAYRTAHRPGARNAPFYFLSNQLFTPQVRDRVYDRLTQLPVLILYDEDPYTGFSELPEFLGHHPNWHAERICPTRGLPHFEQLPQTVHELDRFWHRLNSHPSTA